MSWLRRRKTPGAIYEATHELRTALYKEQGGLCAYCMRHIEIKTSVVEHIMPRSTHPDQQMSYNNMVLCCDGDIGCDACCDKNKGDTEIHFTPTDANFIGTLSYCSADGTLRSSNPQCNEEIDKVLNLNHSLLKSNRKAALDAVINTMGKNDRRWTQGAISQKIELFEAPSTNGCYREYCGIVVWFLKITIVASFTKQHAIDL